jgi:LCP family protein required for cell wall assembly
MKKSGWKKWFVIIPLLLVMIAAGLGFFTAFVVSRMAVIEMLFTLSPTVTAVPEMNVLLLGIDATDGARRSDTIMVMHVDPKTKSVGIVSIPRDTLVVIPGVRLDKINHAYAFGGPELACATTSNFLQIPVSYYIKVNIDGLEKMVDRIGGITLDVEERMFYVDYAGGLYVDLKPGLQKLNGKQAAGYLRFRHDSQNDFGRIKRQQKFLEALAGQLTQTRSISLIYGLIFDFVNSVETNIPSTEMMGLASQVRQAYENGQIQMTMLPGTSTMIDHVYYLQPDMAKIPGIVDQYLRGTQANEIPKEDPQN